MEERQTHALLLSGNELRFIHSATTFYQFLLNEVEVPRERVRLVPYHESTNYDVDEIGNFFQKLPKEKTVDVVIFYNGHGLEGRFLPNGNELGYRDFGRFVTNSGDFILLNDSCYSGSCILPFTDIGLLPDRGMVLASSAPDKKSNYNVFTQRMMDTYRKRRPFTKRVMGEFVYVIDELQKPNLVIDESGQKKLVFPHHSTLDRTALGSIQHPVRAGKSLDQLLYPKQ